jgi:hypothetical protein
MAAPRIDGARRPYGGRDGAGVARARSKHVRVRTMFLLYLVSIVGGTTFYLLVGLLDG